MEKAKRWKRINLVETARSIAVEYRRQGLELTLRQLYYQFVARGLCPSGQKEYHKIGAALSEARYQGRFPVDWLEDRGRNFHPGDFQNDNTDLEAALDNAASEIGNLRFWVNRSKWWGQKTYVTVLFEKEALSGVFGPVCEREGIGYLACKGYPSVSSIHSWLLSADRAVELGAERAVILYSGDHDPDGFGIPKALEEGIERLRQLKTYNPDYPIEVRRIALNMDQIKRFDPPPFDAKESSPRLQRYVEEQGTRDAWELDALEPTVMRDLIREEVRSYFDPDVQHDNEAIVERVRGELEESVSSVDWIQEAIRGGSRQ